MTDDGPAVEEELEGLRTALAGEVDEPIVAAQWFRPPGWGSGLGGLARGLRRIVPGPRAPQQQLRAMNVMALTPTRVVAHRLRTGMGGMSAGKKVGEWPVTEVSIGSKGHTVEVSKSYGDPAVSPDRWSSDMVLVSLRGRGGQPLLIEGDFPKSELTTRLVEGVRQAAASR